MIRRIAAAGGAAALTALVATAGTAGASTATPAGTYALYCSGSSSTAFTGCYADGAAAPVSIPAGSTITTDPVTPATATPTVGLIAPDGILGVFPPGTAAASYGVPSGATAFLYVDKQVGYFSPGKVGGSANVTLSTTPVNIPVTADYTKNFGTGPATLFLGDNSGAASGAIHAVSCQSVTATSLNGCTVPSGSYTTPSGYTVGAPGACTVDGSVLQQIGEGSLSAKTLYKNNEDFAQVRVAYTTDGTTFVDEGAVSTLGNPAATTGARWVAPGGTLIKNSDGSLGLFFSEGQCTDGDSDAFGSVEYATSTDGGVTWSAPSQIADGDTTAGSGYLSTDYTFGASITQQGSTSGALDPSAYFEGRIYSPSVVQNPDGTLTMTFAGYRTPKPLPSTGTGALPLGRACATAVAVGGVCPATGTTAATTAYTPQGTEPALYRNILTVQLTQNAGTGGTTGTPATYSAGVPTVDQVTGGPWTLSQGDPSQAPYGPNGGSSFTTFTKGGGPTIGGYPNLSTYPGAGATGTATPYTTGYAGSPGPLAGYCGTGTYPYTGAVAREPGGVTEPMSPYYFPHIEAGTTPGTLTGFFDYRPKDTDEALVIATSSDGGTTWAFQTEALELSAGHCPNGNSDKALQTTTDDGEGHAFDLKVGGVTWLYTVNRSSGVLDTLNGSFLAHQLTAAYGANLPASEPVGTGSSTTTTGTNTVTNVAGGGASTTKLNVVSTAAFGEIPGRIYVTPAPGTALPESPLSVGLPAAGAGLLGVGYVLVRGRRRRAATA